MPEAPVITTAVASSDQGDEGSTSEGSSIEPGDKPGDSSSRQPLPRQVLSPQALPSQATSHRTRQSEPHGAMRLSQLRRR